MNDAQLMYLKTAGFLEKEAEVLILKYKKCPEGKRKQKYENQLKALQKRIKKELSMLKALLEEGEENS